MQKAGTQLVGGFFRSLAAFAVLGATIGLGLAVGVVVFRLVVGLLS